MFVDAEFPPSDVSLWGKGVRRCFEQLEWMRPQEFCSAKLFDGPLSAPKPCGIHSLRQGLLSDCYLVAAIALLARQASLLSRLFVAYEPEDGWLTVRLFFNGKWEEITLDTFLPCYQRRPAFAHSDEELYGCFLEKACAKAYGSYAALIGGHIDEALWDLTGLPVEEISLLRAPQGLAQKVALHWENGDLLACASISKGAAAQHPRARPNHVYIVAEVSTQSVGLKLKVLDLAQTAAEQGQGREEQAFWVEEHDLLGSFNRLSICHVGMLSNIQTNASASSYNLEVTSANAGGCLNFPTFHNNPMFRVSLRDPQYPQSLAITISQSDMRHLAGEMDRKVTYPQIGVAVVCIDKIVTEVETDLTCCTRNRRKVLVQSPFSSKRNVSVVLPLEGLAAGSEYRVVPSYFFPGDLGVFGKAVGKFGERQLMVHFAPSGPPGAVLVEKLSPRIKTDLLFQGRFQSTIEVQKVKHPNIVSADVSGYVSGSESFQLTLSPKASIFKVASKGQESLGDSPKLIQLTAILTQEESLRWWTRDHLYASLHECFKSFCSDNDLLSLRELESLWSALLVHIPHIGYDIRNLPARWSQRGTESVSFGQFLSQILCLGISKSDLQRAANMTIPTSAKAKASNEARPFIGVAALCNLKMQDLDMRQIELSGESNTEVQQIKCNASLAAGCDMPLMGDVNVWSASFLVRQSEFYLCPLIRGEGAEGFSFHLQVQSSLDLVVQQLEAIHLKREN